MNIYTKIGKRISFYRKKQGLTQAAFSELLGVSEGYVSQFEHGLTKLSFSRMLEVCKILKIDIAQLVSDEAKPEKSYYANEVIALMKHWDKDKLEVLYNFAKYLNQLESTKKLEAENSTASSIK